jgi:hypothetical protein
MTGGEQNLRGQSSAMKNHPIAIDLFRGLSELERTERGWLPHRLPTRARAQCADPQLAAVEAQPAGVRLAFRTRAAAVELDLLRTRTVLLGVPDRPDGVVDLLVDGHLTQQMATIGGDVMRVDPTTGHTEIVRGSVATMRFTALPAQDKEVEIWLPYYERTEIVALRTDAQITRSPNSGRRVWLHHGSSISQGSNAASPSSTWPALAAALAGVELINLGLAGSAMLDQFTARTMRDTPADVISIKIGINLVNADAMRLRAFAPAVHGFLDTVRDGHPTTRMLVVGPLHCPIHENTPGPITFDVTALAAGTIQFIATGDRAEAMRGKLTLSVIRDQLAEIMAARAVDDPHLFYLDGQDLYGANDVADYPLPDNLHPDAATHRIIGERFARLAFSAGKPLKT